MTAHAATYYVDPGGSNSNSGTSPSAPWQNPPGTRTASNSGFISSSWGAITAANKIQCGDTILLKGGSTQTSGQGGGWRIDNGPNADGSGYYPTTCSSGSPISIRVASSSEWPGSSGPFILDGTGVTATCLAGCSSAGGLIHIQDIGNIVLGGVNASQRLIVRNSSSNGIMLFTSGGGTCASCGAKQLDTFLGQYLDISNSNGFGITLPRVRDALVKQTISHDNNDAGFNTGYYNDHRCTACGFEDVEAYRNGLPAGSNGDQFLFLGCESCWLIRGKSHDGLLRGLNYGEVGGGYDMQLTIRDSEFWDNGQTTDNNAVYQSGPCWSGDDKTDGVLQRGILERSVIFHNRESGGPCAYGQGWAEVWNSVWSNNGYDSSVGGQGDIAVAGQADLNYFGVFNSIVQRRGNSLTWTASGPSGFGTKKCPVSDYNLFRPLSSDSEVISDFECVGSNGFSVVAKTYAAPPAFIGAHSKIGGAYTVGFIRLDDAVYANNDLHLSSGSSAIDAGTYMFRATDSGSGTTLSVTGNGGSSDPRHYFISPLSYNQASADTLQIKGASCQNAVADLGSSERAKVISMTANSITLDRSCSWSQGAGIHLPWNGNAPDLGAFEFGASGVDVLAGDLNADGQRTLLDVRWIIEMLVGLRSTNLTTADLTRDGQLTLADVQTLVRLFAGLP